MPSGPVAESESRFESNLSSLSEERTQSPGTVGCDWVRWVEKAMGFGHKI